jgi:hypothetical protein
MVKLNLKNILGVTVLLACAAYAASTFIANDQPLGFIAPAAVSTNAFDTGTAIAYAPWFETVSFRGNIIAYPITNDGTPLLLSPLWNAMAELDALDPAARHIVTTDGAGTALPFFWDDMPGYQATLGSELMVNFLRGDRTNEGTPPTTRVRNSALGDIIHSNPVFVKNPVAGYAEPSYLTFAADNYTRDPLVYVGANDGMLHAFDALTGVEIFAYIPSMVVGNLPKLAFAPYTHSYFVDGQLTAGDVKYSDDWHSLLVGGLGAGGDGYFALDITEATITNDQDVMDKVLWEIDATSTDLSNLGDSYSRASIVNTNKNVWAVVIGNGYNSASGVASLIVLDASDGSVIREIITPDVASNGLSTPALIDINEDLKADYAYAGDRNGNLWKFDLRDDDPTNWGVSNSEALFVTDGGLGTRQSITTPPVVGYHPKGGYMIYIATGELFAQGQSADKSLNTAYGIWDNDWSAADTPIAQTSVVSQTLYINSHPSSGASVRTASNNPINWETKKGWRMPLLISGAAELDKGERVIQELTLRDDRLQFITVNPTYSTGENWYIQLDAITGGAPSKSVVDVNKDLVVSVADNVDGDGDGLVTDTELDRVVGTYLGFGISSLPTIGSTTSSSAAALFNHIEAISPTDIVIINEPGLVGGHFDLDTSSKIYKFDNGNTDGHVHEWDDNHDETTINYFSMLDGVLNPINHSGKGVPNGTTPFFITVSNSDLSNGGIMEINGASFSVTTYQAIQRRWLAGTMADHEIFPTFQLDPLDPDVAADQLKIDAGWKQLTSLKMSFDAFSILKGQLLGTETGCVRGNKIGTVGEYRNGALTIQALDGTDFDGFTYDAVNDVYIAANTAVDGTHNYARIKPVDDTGQTTYTGNMFWESTVFWHWDGDCYNTAAWQTQYDACWVTGTETCWSADALAEDKAEKTKDGDKDADKDAPPPDDSDPDPDPVADPEHSLESIRTADESKVGRLFWRELVPD